MHFQRDCAMTNDNGDKMQVDSHEHEYSMICHSWRIRSVAGYVIRCSILQRTFSSIWFIVDSLWAVVLSYIAEVVVNLPNFQ